MHEVIKLRAGLMREVTKQRAGLMRKVNKQRAGLMREVIRQRVRQREVAACRSARLHHANFFLLHSGLWCLYEL